MRKLSTGAARALRVSLAVAAVLILATPAVGHVQSVVAFQHSCFFANEGSGLTSL